MTMSNKFGWLVLTTGNKSEMATGYATLYGDMAGGFAVIKDVPKTLVYALVHVAQRARAGHAVDPASDHRQAADRPSCGPTRATPTRCPPTTCSTRSSRATSRTTADADDSSPRGYDRDDRAARDRGWSTATSTSAARRRPGCKITPKAFGGTAACRSRTATG